MHILLILGFAVPSVFAHTSTCGQRLTSVEASLTGSYLYPRPVTLAPELFDHPQVQSLAQRWAFEGLGRTEPALVARVTDPKTFGRAGAPRTFEQPIKFPGTGYAVPSEAAQFSRILQKLIDIEHTLNPGADDSYAYLTIEQTDGTETPEPRGWHTYGFHGTPRAQEQWLDHSYVVSSFKAHVFTRQKFSFRDFDYGTFDTFAELNRQALPEFEDQARPFGVYLLNGNTPLRNAHAHHGTTLRLTFSKKRFDLAVRTPNPMFPYSLDPKPSEPKAPLRRYMPRSGINVLETVPSFEMIKGQRVGLITMGDDGGRGAAILAELLRRSGRDVKFLVTIREMAEQANFLRPKDYPERVFDGKIEVTALFSEMDRVGPTVLVKLMSNPKAEVDSIILVDVGGRTLAPSFAQVGKTNWQKLITSLTLIPQAPYLAVIAPGYGLPADHPITSMFEAKRYVPTPADRAYALAADARWSAKIGESLDPAYRVWLQSLTEKFGPQQFPTQYAGEPPLEILPDHQSLILAPLDPTVMILNQALRGVR